MEGEAPAPVPSTTSRLREARERAVEVGHERRLETGQKIRGFFTRMRETVKNGIDFTLGLPVFGREVAQIGKEKAIETRDSVIEAGTRAWESVVDTKDRLIQRGIDAKDRLVARCEQTRDNTKNKAVDLARRADVWGWSKVYAPVEERIKQIYLIPNAITGRRAQRKDIKGERLASKADLITRLGEAKAAATKEEAEAIIAEIMEKLQADLAETEEKTQAESSALRGESNSAYQSAGELWSKANKRRREADRRFSKARTMVASLQAR